MWKLNNIEKLEQNRENGKIRENGGRLSHVGLEKIDKIETRRK